MIWIECSDIDKVTSHDRNRNGQCIGTIGNTGSTIDFHIDDIMCTMDGTETQITDKFRTVILSFQGDVGNGIVGNDGNCVVRFDRRYGSQQSIVVTVHVHGNILFRRTVEGVQIERDATDIVLRETYRASFRRKS